MQMNDRQWNEYILPGRDHVSGSADHEGESLMVSTASDSYTKASSSLKPSAALSSLKDNNPESNEDCRNTTLSLESSESGLKIAHCFAAMGSCSPLSLLSGTGEEDREIKAILEKMVTENPGFLQMRTLVKAARKFGLKNMEKLESSGVKFDLHPPDPFAEIQRNLVAEYLPRKKTVHIAPGRLSVSTTLHEMGHALDDVLEPDEKPEAPVLLSERDAHLSQLYNSYKSHAEDLSWWERLRGEGFWSDYATTNVHEYLADGIMFFTQSERKKESLHAADPHLYEYIKNIMEK